MQCCTHWNAHSNGHLDHEERIALVFNFVIEASFPELEKNDVGCLHKHIIRCRQRLVKTDLIVINGRMIIWLGANKSSGSLNSIPICFDNDKISQYIIMAIARKKWQKKDYMIWSIFFNKNDVKCHSFNDIPHDIKWNDNRRSITLSSIDQCYLNLN